MTLAVDEHRLTAAGKTSACVEKRNLARQFAIAVRVYSATVATFTQSLDIVSGKDYDRLQAAADEARQISEAIRIELERHIESHGCLEL